MIYSMNDGNVRAFFERALCIVLTFALAVGAFSEFMALRYQKQYRAFLMKRYRATFLQALRAVKREKATEL